MTIRVTTKSHPHLYEAFCVLAQDCEEPMPQAVDLNMTAEQLAEAEDSLAMLTAEERVTLTIGEEGERDELCETKKFSLQLAAQAMEEYFMEIGG